MADDVKRKHEDEWFAKHERDMIEELKRERKRKEAQLAELAQQEEFKKRKEIHWMKCPKCGSDLQEMDIGGTKIDKCSTCEGMFFDRGEFEGLLLKKQDERRSFIRRLTGLFSS